LDGRSGYGQACLELYGTRWRADYGQGVSYFIGDSLRPVLGVAAMAAD
jgi:hypothetical protein